MTPFTANTRTPLPSVSNVAAPVMVTFPKLIREVPLLTFTPLFTMRVWFPMLNVPKVC